MTPAKHHTYAVDQFCNVHYIHQVHRVHTTQETTRMSTFLSPHEPLPSPPSPLMGSTNSITCPPPPPNTSPNNALPRSCASYTTLGNAVTSVYVPGTWPPPPDASTKSNTTDRGSVGRNRRATRCPLGRRIAQVMASWVLAGGSGGREAAFAWRRVCVAMSAAAFCAAACASLLGGGRA